jgi:signal transduction histidine kinase
MTLLNDILDLTRVESGKLELVSSTFDPAQILAEASALFEEMVRAKGLQFHSSWDDAHRQSYRADAIRLRQMLSNLIGNAIKFTDQGRIRVEGRVLERLDGEAVLEFSVTDTGIGIAQSKRPLLFEPFSQIDAFTTRRAGGSGLGLSIVRNLATLMGGRVGVESVEGQGSRFWFTIRARIEDVESPGASPAAQGLVSQGLRNH